MQLHRGQPRTFLRITAAAIVLGAGALGTVASCAESFPDNTAEVHIDGRTIVFDLDACGLDGETVLLVGGSEDDLLQVAIGVEGDDPPRAVADSSGISIDESTDSWAAFGESSWALRDGEGDAPGEIHEVEIEGSRVTLVATAAPVDGARRVEGSTVEIELEARCDGDAVA